MVTGCMTAKVLEWVRGFSYEWAFKRMSKSLFGNNNHINDNQTIFPNKLFDVLLKAHL